MKRKLLVFAAVMVMLIAALCASAFAAEVVDSGKCGENVTWTLDSDGVLTISGEGTMYDCQWRFLHEDKIKEVIISDGVTLIPNEAFCDCTLLSKVIIPNSVTSIDLAAFMGCESLTSVSIPNSVTHIGSWAFFGCSFTTITIPASVTSIGQDALRTGCLQKIIVDENNPEYSSDMFGVLYNKDKQYLIQAPDEITHYDVPNGVKEIDSYAFNGCASLERVSIPVSVTMIWDYAFVCCTSLKSIIISDGVEYIGYRAFNDCDSLTDVYYTGSEEQWGTIDIFLDNESNKSLINAAIHYNYVIPADHPLGDIDGDGKVENSDLVTIARYIVGLTEGDTTTAVEAYADMNGDSKVDNSDIVTVARKIVGLA